MKDDYFIRLIRISDNLGNVWKEGKSRPKVVLKAGDEYELVIEAYDPKQRDIQYELFTLGSFDVSQKSNRINFTICNKLVGNPTMFTAKVSTPDSEYKNWDSVILHITVLPE